MTLLYQLCHAIIKLRTVNYQITQQSYEATIARDLKNIHLFYQGVSITIIVALNPTTDKSYNYYHYTVSIVIDNHLVFTRFPF